MQAICPLIILFDTSSTILAYLVVLKKGKGLKKDSIVNLSQIRTIDKKRLITTKIAELSNSVMKEVDNSIMLSLGVQKLG